MNASKSVIRQLVAEAVCRGIVEQIAPSYALTKEKMPPKVVKLVVKAIMDCKDIRRKIEVRNDILVIDGKMQMEPKTYERYRKKYNAVRDTFRKPGRETMPASQALTSALAIADAMKDMAPDHDRRLDWNSLENHLTDLYRLYDPDMDDFEAMQQGIADCEELMRITA